MRQLRDAGVNAGVLMAPVVPGFTTQPARLEATIKAVADHGAAFLGANVMHLKDGTRDHFMRFLGNEYPALVDSYNRLYAGAYARSDYVKTVKGMIDVLRSRYQLDHRRYGNEEALPEGAEPVVDESVQSEQRRLPLI